MALAVLIGAATGAFGTWVFHYIIEANAAYINTHRPLVLVVGTLGLLAFSKVVYDIKGRNARSYGLLLIGLGCGIFIQAILYFKESCSDDCSTDFILKLVVCVIVIVDGLTHYSRKSETELPKN